MICYIIMGADAKLRSRNVYKKTLARCAAAEGFRSSLASWADRGKVCPGACTHANTAADLLACGALPTCMAAASHGDVPRGAGSCPRCSPTHVLVESTNPLVRSASYSVRPAGGNSANTRSKDTKSPGATEWLPRAADNRHVLMQKCPSNPEVSLSNYLIKAALQQSLLDCHFSYYLKT